MSKLFDLTGRVAIVTGGGRGLGRTIALGLADHGADVVVVSRTMEQVERVAGEIQGKGRKALALRVDTSRKADVDAMVSRALDRWGRIDVLVNNAGIDIIKPAVDYAEAEWDQILDINLKGYFLCAQAVGRQMIAQRSGSILMNGSIAGSVGSPSPSPSSVSIGVSAMISASSIVDSDSRVGASVSSAASTTSGSFSFSGFFLLFAGFFAAGFLAAGFLAAGFFAAFFLAAGSVVSPLTTQRWAGTTSTTVVNSSPSRCTVNGAGPSSARTAVTISSKLATGVSPTFTTVSPAWMPAAAAGEGARQSPSCPLLTSALTHDVSPTTAVVGACRLGSPQTTAMP